VHVEGGNDGQLNAIPHRHSQDLDPLLFQFPERTGDVLALLQA
jgi:hypothetical protein